MAFEAKTLVRALFKKNQSENWDKIETVYDLECDNCDYVIEIIEDYFEPFFFSNYIINI